MRSRPREVLFQALGADTEPLVKALREEAGLRRFGGESDGTTDGRFAVVIEIRLDGIPVPREAS